MKRHHLALLIMGDETYKKDSFGTIGHCVTMAAPIGNRDKDEIHVNGGSQWANHLHSLSSGEGYRANAKRT